jgi:hypothetical protein
MRKTWGKAVGGTRYSRRGILPQNTQALWVMVPCALRQVGKVLKFAPINPGFSYRLFTNIMQYITGVDLRFYTLSTQPTTTTTTYISKEEKEKRSAS